MNSRYVCAILAGVGMVVAAPPLNAQSTVDAKQVERLYAEGAALYREGKYRAAIERFEAAYALYPEPNLQYNIGRAYEALANIEAAIAAYERCVAEDATTPAVRQKAEARIKMLAEAREQSQAAVEPPPPPSPVSPPDEVRPAPPNPAASKGAVVRVEQTRPESKPAVMTVVRWSTAGLAVALVGAGAVVYGLGSSDHGTVNDAISSAGGEVASLTMVEAQRRIDDGRQKKTIGVTLGGVGLAAAATAVALFLWNDDAGSTVSAGLTVDEDRAAVSVGGRF